MNGEYLIFMFVSDSQFFGFAVVSGRLSAATSSGNFTSWHLLGKVEVATSNLYGIIGKIRNFHDERHV